MSRRAKSADLETSNPSLDRVDLGAGHLEQSSLHRGLQEAQLVAQAGSSTSTTSLVPSSFTGCTWRATASPTASSHRPNTPPIGRRLSVASRRELVRNERTTLSRLSPKGTRIATHDITMPASMRTIASGWAASGRTPAVVSTDLAGREVSEQCFAAPGVEFAEHIVEHQHRGAAGLVGHQCDAQPAAAPARACAARPATRACAPACR